MGSSKHNSPAGILFVHGAGNVDEDGWKTVWSESLLETLQKDYSDLFPPSMTPAKAPFYFADYHDVLTKEFTDQPLKPEDLIAALGSLGWASSQPSNNGNQETGTSKKWDSWDQNQSLTGILRGSRGLSALVEALYWNAGMIVRWVSDSQLRQDLRDALEEELRKKGREISIIAAHSLGSLIAYDLFRHKPDLVEDRTFISFGSQIGNAFVRAAFNGRLEGLPMARYWLHLYNPNDATFTAEIRMHGADLLQHPSDTEKRRRNFFQIYTPFDNPDPLDNTAVSTGGGTVGYLDTYEARQLAWPRAFENIERPHGKSQGHLLTETLRKAISIASEGSGNRALLIGIDHYQRADIPDLSGCANDTYLMSQILQEQGFPVQDIRVLQNDRATAAAIRDRLDWLLDDMDDGDFRFLFFSGHGHQLESYGPTERSDRLDECLCPYDYNYSVETAILDDHIFDLYSQIPYDSQFVIALDCCHSGGMARSGNAHIRGLSAPMDIAHRGLEWQQQPDSDTGLWLRRASGASTLGKTDTQDFRLNCQLPSRATTNKHYRDLYVGSDSTVRRLFRGLALRRKIEEDGARNISNKTKLGNKGPYLPVIIQACEENDVALEHSDGLASHGAFTFCFGRVLRRLQPILAAAKADKRAPSWNTIVNQTRLELRALGYTQSPQILVATAQRHLNFTPKSQPNKDED